MGMITLLVIEAPKVYFNMQTRASRTILHAAISVRARPMIVSQITKSRPTLLVGGVVSSAMLMSGDTIAPSSSTGWFALLVCFPAGGIVFCFLDFPRLVFADFAFVLSLSFVGLGLFLADWVVDVTGSSVGVVVGM